jgi:amino-acid N-acetyltransferase
VIETVIVFANPGDGAAVRRLLRESGLPDQDVSEGLLANFLLAKHGAALVGVVGLELLGRYGLLRSLAVAPARRGRGLGLELTRALESHARWLGVEKLYLLTTTAEDFFRAHGYRRAPRDDLPAAVQGTTEYRALCPSTAVCMVKSFDFADSPGI